MRRSSAEIVVVLTVGLLTTGLAGGCADEPESAPVSPPMTIPPTTTSPTTTSPKAHALPTAAPLPLPRPQPPIGPERPEPGLGTEDRARLAEARRIGASWVILLVASAPGQDAKAATDLKLLGGVLGTTSPGSGYLRVTMPTDNVERAAALPAIAALDIEQVVAPNHPRPTG